MDSWMPQTNRRSGIASLPGWMASLPNSSRRALCGALPVGVLPLIETDWRLWSRSSQRPPEGDWATWLFLGGRGAGKTRAGAEWLTMRARAGRRLALVGPTLHDVREVMIDGPSGLRAIAPPGRRPVYEVSRRRLVWPNGAVAQAFSAEDPESLRGPQFHDAWADEFCAWRKPGEVLAMLRMGLRLGDDPRLAVTTTPKPQAALRTLMAEPSAVTTRAATAENEANLSAGFRAGLKTLYGGTRLEAQELDGQVLDLDGGLWTHEMLARARGRAPEDLETVVIGLDPSTTAGGDACGIVVVGRRGGTAYVLADETLKGRSPSAWAARVAELAAVHEADWVVAETNQGGQMVDQLLTMARCGARVKPVHASASKRVRAEPVAALYEQGRVVHCGAFPELEEELMGFGDPTFGRSPDRADALVWAVGHLLLTARGAPRLRAL